MKKQVVSALCAVIFSTLVVSCGNSGSKDSNETTTTPEATVPDFESKLSAARKAESAFETVLADAPDLATAMASKEYTDLQKAMKEATAAAKTDKEKTDVANLQKLIDVLINQ